ncbi:Sigma-70 region 4 domain protein [metagenome]|uniref:Sigma-70 region 4 domain protein n=1 Tax=metagenome TaxID=256318 RepID=A0A2P2C7I0_9ZZZZ
MGVARAIAARYRNRGICDEDLEQVAYLALVRVAHAYDHSCGCDFMSYAVPSIRGAVRRHFRDHGWMVRPPRRIQELQARMSAAQSGLATTLGHPPTPAELAAELGETDRDVRAALGAQGCFRPTSLDQPARANDEVRIGDLIQDEDDGLQAAEARVMIRPLLQRLTPRERRILQMRFIEDRTQQQIGEEIGVTQMQVSRLLAQILLRLRADLERTRPLKQTA